MRWLTKYRVLALVLWMAGPAIEPLASEPVAADAADTGARHFDRRVAPVLASYCLDCHRGAEPEGGLDLSNRDAAFTGGESGVAIQRGKSSDSLLWQRIESGEMPPKDRLPDEAKRAIRQWIENGAAWGSDPIDPFRFTTARRAGSDWWSLQPLAPIQPPAPLERPTPLQPPEPLERPYGQATASDRGPIDRFLIKALEQRGLTLSGDASPRAQIRRLYFGLTGLPPSPEAVRTFLADPSDKAYAVLVDRLLLSPAYGERWGRHWLDVARFGESDGFERNNPRTNLWPYRDWVIDALNNDMPYDEFVRMQIAGDVITGDAPDGLAAVGFLVAGVHNTVVGSSEMMRRAARQDELEEIVGAIGQTFLGLTVNCGRCHDHKFDPIRQREYYQLTAAIAGVNHGERESQATATQRQLAGLDQRIGDVSKRLRDIDDPVVARILALRKDGQGKPPQPPRALACWEFDKDLSDRLGNLHGTAVAGTQTKENGPPNDNGLLVDGALVVDGKRYVQTSPISKRLAEKTLEAWVVLDNLDQRGGAAISVQTADGGVFDAIVFGEREPKRWMAGSDSFRRTKSFGGTIESSADEQPVHVAIVYEADGTIIGYRNGKPYGKPYKSTGPRVFEAGTAHVVFGLRHLPAGGNRMLRGRILRAKLYDRALSPDAIAASAGADSRYVAESEIVEQLKPARRAARRQLVAERKTLLEQRKQLNDRARRKIYTVKPSVPGATHFLRRGDAMDLGPVVEPAGLSAIAGVKADFQLPPNASDALRRRALAQFVAHRDNPLLARVIVNRLWHHHFGIGLVETPNDFGFNGGRPSHPRLLDWLAGELVRRDFRLKPIHRLIVQSSAYRQASRWNAKAAGVDAGNRYLWRRTPRRMEAEVLRDSLLAVSGKLNAQRGGPGFVDVQITVNNGTTYYSPIDRDDDQLNRRTVYRFCPRGGRSALLDTFDCPDPATAAPRRSVTTTPMQALSLLNNPFVLRMADHFARRVKKEAGDDWQRQVARAYWLVYGREPEDDERRIAGQFVRQYGLAAFARALFNSNEFVVVD